MGFVKSAEEVAAIERVLARPRFVNCEMLSVTAAVDEDYLVALLPPPLRLATASARFMVGRWQSNCVGDYAGGAIYIPAVYMATDGAIEGEYVLAMYMDSDVAITFGRDLFGEPKKLCRTALYRNDKMAVGWVERNGTRLFELRGLWTSELGPSRTAGRNFNIKSLPSCTGAGLEDDPVLTLAEFEVMLREHRTGVATVELAGTHHDPLDTIPVTAVRHATWQAGDLTASARRLARIPASAFAPYHHGRNDDWTLLNTDTRDIMPV